MFDAVTYAYSPSLSLSKERPTLDNPSAAGATNITLSQAVDNNMLSVAKQLLESGVSDFAFSSSPSSPSSPSSLLLRLIAICSLHPLIHGYIEMMELLIDNGAYTYLVDNSGNTPLHWAARNGNLAAVAVLCRSAPTTYVENANCRTPLKEARKHGHPEIVQYLAFHDSTEESEQPEGSEFEHTIVDAVVSNAFHFPFNSFIIHVFVTGSSVRSVPLQALHARCAVRAC
ncbi:unnamed protein product [Hydatigera taeniaeformis]|uniref:ANK_REP_REGION domain-containing protein n=1 Tax=Hydatigena taeniaeformis TaxID=6205 RepID=A0A0R3XBW7_HYDTA|nr:unnamed protein product [Hydatigera taeniaeformis]